jgi:hypothetical protein
MRTTSILFLTAILALALAEPAGAAHVHRFKTEEAAQKHCPKDEIVWGSSRGTYYPKESHFYGKSRGGAYVCAREAYAAGWRQESE